MNRQWRKPSPNRGGTYRPSRECRRCRKVSWVFAFAILATEPNRLIDEYTKRTADGALTSSALLARVARASVRAAASLDLRAREFPAAVDHERPENLFDGEAGVLRLQNG